MARLRGSASEHHPEGPGDAPRKKRMRRSSSSVERMPGASILRAASPDVEVRQPKRPKRVQLDVSDQLVRELNESVARSQDDEHYFRRARRHSEPLVAIHGEHDDASDADTTPPATQPLPGLTPHLNRVGAPRGRPTNIRRARMSMPAQLHLDTMDDEEGSQFQFAPLSAVLDSRTRRRLRRSHLSEEVNELEEHQKEDKKLRKAYAELHHQLREKDKLVNDLKFQLEAKRLGDIDISDDHAQELEDELERAKKEIEELRASSVYTPVSRDHSTFDGAVEFEDDDDDDDLMLIEPDELDVPMDDVDAETPTQGTYARRAIELSSQITRDSLSSISQTVYDTLASQQTDTGAVPDRISDKAVKRYEAEIERLTQEVAASQGALRVVVIELQNLHVVQPGASTDSILTNLRHGLETLRNEIERLVPNTTAGLTNSELLHKIPELFEGILAELHDQVLLAESHRKNEKLLRAQYEHVIDLLARSEDRNGQLDQLIKEMDESLISKTGAIAGLEEEVTTLTEALDGQDDQIKLKDMNLHNLERDVAEKDTALTRFRDALAICEKDLDTVSKTLTNLEEEHVETIARMEAEHAEAVEDLTSQLEVETEGRKIAEEDAQQKSSYIDELEHRIDGLDTEISAIAEQLITLREHLTDETTLRETAEAERDEYANTAYEHANTIENLTENIADLKSQISELRDNLATECAQREQTEATLDAANDDIADLNAQLHDASVQANELRSKLFEVQQQKEEAIAELKEDNEILEEELQGLLATETQQRQLAEQNVAELEEKCTGLFNDLNAAEVKIEELSQALNRTERSRDEQVVSLKSQLAELDTRYTALENNTKSEITSLNANITDLNNQIARYRADIEHLRHVAEDNERTFADEKASMSAQIEELQSDLNTAQDLNETQAERIKSLERRVEDEATELLNIMGSHTQEIQALQSVIANQEAIIQDLQNTATERTAEHEEIIAEKESEIEELRLLTDVRAEDIVNLQAQMEEMKEHFRVQEEDTRATIDNLMESQRRLQEHNEQLADALKKRNADTLKAVQEMKYKGVEVRTKGVDLRKVVNGKIGKISEKVKIGKKKGGVKKISKRQWDSGIGVDDKFDAEDDELSLEPVAS